MATTKKATVKKATTKKAAPKVATKTAPVKKTAVKKAATKKVATKAAAKMAPTVAKTVPVQSEERYRQVEMEAFLMAEKDGFKADPLCYWIAAEKKVIQARG